MIARKVDIQEFAERCLRLSTEVAESIQLSHRYSKDVSEEAKASSSLGNDPSLARLPCFYGMKAWAAILSVDLRKSSNRAIELGARDTYRSMHTYLPTMAEIVRLAHGKIIGLRGDGLFAAFGLTEENKSGGYSIDEKGINNALMSASDCGKAMVEATDEVLEPLFKSHNIIATASGPVIVGVGIDIGEIVVTKIGITDANEITAYGPAVNQACKLCSGNGEIRFTHGAKEKFPTSKGGRISFANCDGFYRLVYPHDMKMLSP